MVLETSDLRGLTPNTDSQGGEHGPEDELQRVKRKSMGKISIRTPL